MRARDEGGDCRAAAEGDDLRIDPYTHRPLEKNPRRAPRDDDDEPFARPGLDPTAPANAASAELRGESWATGFLRPVAKARAAERGLAGDPPKPTAAPPTAAPTAAGARAVRLAPSPLGDERDAERRARQRAVLARLLGSPAWARAFSLSGAFVGFAPALELACVDELGELDDRLDGTHRLSKPHARARFVALACARFEAAFGRGAAFGARARRARRLGHARRRAVRARRRA